MPERLDAWGVKNVLGFVFKTLLEALARENLEQYTQNFFSTSLLNLSISVGIRQQEGLEIVFGKALKEFLSLVQQELEDADLSEEEIKQYIPPLQQFIHQQYVQVELGQPFVADKLTNASSLVSIWNELDLKPLPADFNWQLLTKRYARKVKFILQESDELYSILDTKNLEAIQQKAQEFAGILPDFDLLSYRREIQKTYGNLRLDSFDTSGYSYSLKLWNMFIPQNVREVNEALPQIYELPKEELERLKKNNELDEDANIKPEILEKYKRDYIQQSSRSILAVINDKQIYKYIVILGDPGSGKSSLLQYLTQQWAETPLENLSSLSIPLLIELRTYVRSRDNQKCGNFLEFFEQGSGFICPLNRNQLDTLLKTGKAYVMFDGLDEVFEPGKREEAITDIINFTHNYPLVRVLVTSRVIGYKPTRLRDANFRHLMLQDLEPEQIQDFINRWHNFAFIDPLDKQRKQKRLESAIKDFLAIRQLASNPLLLTMMAILNRNQELPRDRAELYNQASRVLLQQWDLERLLINVETASIDYKDKQAMLRQVAYSMQTNKKGLSGNLIQKDDLKKILIAYLQSIGIHQEQRIAQLIIDQLRERNFILCFLGADYYAFVHRTFLEYFCAWEYVWQFEKEGNIKIEDITNHVFGKHWQDETWHEVLRLIAGMINPKFVGQIIDYLIKQENGETEKFINLFLAAKCLSEIRNPLIVKSQADELLQKIKDLIKYDLPYYYDSYDKEANLVREIHRQAVATVATIWQDDPETKTFLKNRATADEEWDVQGVAIEALASNLPDDPETKTILKNRATADEDNYVRGVAIEALASNFSDDPETKAFLKNRATADEDNYVRRVAIEALASNFSDDPETKAFLKNRATADEDNYVRRVAIQELASNFPDDPETKTFLKNRATADEKWYVRGAAIEALANNFPDDPETKTFFKNRATTDEDDYVRGAAIQALASNFPDDPETKTFVKNRANADEDNDVRSAAIEALASNFPDDPETKTILKNRATADEKWDVRRAAIQALASNFPDDPETKTILKNRATGDENYYVRSAAIEALASNFPDDPETKTILKNRATADEDNYVRGAAIEALASNFPDDPETKTILKNCATADEANYVRGAAIQALGKNFRFQSELFEIYYNCAVNNPFDISWLKNNPRRIALEIIIKQYPQHPQTLPLLRDKAENDPDKRVREFAQKKLTELEG